MEIVAQIDYYGSGVATFDPQKVLERLGEAIEAYEKYLAESGSELARGIWWPTAAAA